MQGPYDSGYVAVPCFWGRRPSSLVRKLIEVVPRSNGLRALDAGCGEGKNAVALASRGVSVTAVEISEAAIRNGRRAWPDVTIEWVSGDITTLEWQEGSFDIVIAYGLLHCLSSDDAIRSTVRRLQKSLSATGYFVLCSFNDRHQELEAHPEFHPCLIGHNDYTSFFNGWDVLHSSDTDLRECHPHNEIWHVHSMTRILARKR